jgi:hypothetical protein
MNLLHNDDTIVPKHPTEVPFVPLQKSFFFFVAQVVHTGIFISPEIIDKRRDGRIPSPNLGPTLHHYRWWGDILAWWGPLLTGEM